MRQYARQPGRARRARTMRACRKRRASADPGSRAGQVSTNRVCRIRRIAPVPNRAGLRGVFEERAPTGGNELRRWRKLCRAAPGLPRAVRDCKPTRQCQIHEDQPGGQAQPDSLIPAPTRQCNQLQPATAAHTVRASRGLANHATTLFIVIRGVLGGIAAKATITVTNRINTAPRIGLLVQAMMAARSRARWATASRPLVDHARRQRRDRQHQENRCIGHGPGNFAGSGSKHRSDCANQAQPCENAPTSLAGIPPRTLSDCDNGQQHSQSARVYPMHIGRSRRKIGIERRDRRQPRQSLHREECRGACPSQEPAQYGNSQFFRARNCPRPAWRWPSLRPARGFRPALLRRKPPKRTADERHRQPRSADAAARRRTESTPQPPALLHRAGVSRSTRSS